MKRLLSLFLLPVIFVSAQELKQNQTQLSGVLALDSKMVDVSVQTKHIKSPLDETVAKKKPLVAAGLSLLLPGAGEFYSESYIKSAVFLAAEAAAIAVGLAYDKKGNDQTTFFQNYADQHWSAARYAKWVSNPANTKNINAAVDPAKYNVFYTSGKVNWTELNRLESDLGSYFSHRLPYYGEQQYFELIGKYPQFNVGWDDFGDENTPFEYKADRSNLTNNFKYYSVERGKANDFYNIASKAVIVVVVNHLISAIDAAWSAHSYNKSIELHTSIEKFQNGFTSYYYPELHLQYRF
ncbi:MAG: hypothetical protein A2440_03600 [Stygiobacter sp. RIFOXYC2_FULL_38_25]|nr:MAG: hypothetical protein A2X62_06825 [Stygiobacter sp. GWC2_38_9]OGV06280.1 MAG: hypothetical protein A2299_12675 [Stygiobacter sp. RIFOXYB2_FULL_37_11]OGV16030.1 MAG: hypothetical protein A2440_03600 [Stygiobacter sp. RIFOXYC2_FULL_38_25]OGV17954.1 MAG: hypothetical protein A2237_07965 [Stygiobacter sp. RIFOXYA2_FULL_38_8]OGV80507.1 MAG: hypothetical protein A2X65_04760 [Stygiobacter sp. GWF2_38_21]